MGFSVVAHIYHDMSAPESALLHVVHQILDPMQGSMSQVQSAIDVELFATVEWLDFFRSFIHFSSCTFEYFEYASCADTAVKSQTLSAWPMRLCFYRNESFSTFSLVQLHFSIFKCAKLRFQPKFTPNSYSKRMVHSKSAHEWHYNVRVALGFVQWPLGSDMCHCIQFASIFYSFS